MPADILNYYHFLSHFGIKFAIYIYLMNHIPAHISNKLRIRMTFFFTTGCYTLWVG